MFIMCTAMWNMLHDVYANCTKRHYLKHVTIPLLGQQHVYLTAFLAETVGSSDSIFPLPIATDET